MTGSTTSIKKLSFDDVHITPKLLIGMLIGVYSALRQYSFFDQVSTGGAFVGLSIPNFWFALLLQIFFGVYLTKWLHLTSPIFYTAGLSKPGSSGFNVVDRARHLDRTDPYVVALARYVLEGALDSTLPAEFRPARRAGVMRTSAVTSE